MMNLSCAAVAGPALHIFTACVCSKVDAVAEGAALSWHDVYHGIGQSRVEE